MFLRKLLMPVRVLGAGFAVSALGAASGALYTSIFVGFGYYSAKCAWEKNHFSDFKYNCTAVGAPSKVIDCEYNCGNTTNLFMNDATAQINSDTESLYKFSTITMAIGGFVFGIVVAALIARCLESRRNVNPVFNDADVPLVPPQPNRHAFYRPQDPEVQVVHNADENNLDEELIRPSLT